MGKREGDGKFQAQECLVRGRVVGMGDQGRWGLAGYVGQVERVLGEGSVGDTCCRPGPQLA